jgi:hypothetical protein
LLSRALFIGPLQRHTTMRLKSLLFITTICALAAQALPHHGDEHEDISSPDQPTAIDHVPSNEADASPAIAYIPPQDDVKESHSDSRMGMSMDMGMDGMEHHDPVVDGPIPPEKMSYWLWPEHRGLLYAHIALMTIAWGFALPVGMFYSYPSSLIACAGVMLGVAQSTFHIPVQMCFLALTTLGVIFAIMYNSVTPDFYENNAHHKIGWVIVWMLIAQIASGMIRGVARYVHGVSPSRSLEIPSPENMFILGGEDEEDEEDEAEIKRNPGFRRKSSNSGNETGEGSSRGASTSDGQSVMRRSSENTLLDDHERNFHNLDSSFGVRNTESKIGNYLAKKLQNHGWLFRISRRGAFIARIVHGVIGRPIFCLGFIQICTGVVTVTGIFKGDDIYNGLAHFIKGIILRAASLS